MANFNGLIEEVVVGDDFQVVRTIDNISVGQSLAEAWFTIKENNWSSSYIFQKHITTSNVEAQGVISDTGNTDTIANLHFNLTAEDTLLLKPFYGYAYDIQVKTNTGLLYTPEIGIFTPQAGLTAAI